ncbi:tRNA methyltransferase 10 homolog B-like isoform X3 [Ruditapes philippinarum]|uniref:tRNA methyltransferase 10 homolog B-like isoform X3 n=1 Tax=Ruditapes philippinarum TaxID=129788 RepID=UPI00295B2E50|nr:tRNA methyltransferase 10 homolog B-like isoform X3 [Ruditapes philippinarum]
MLFKSEILRVEQMAESDSQSLHADNVTDDCETRFGGAQLGNPQTNYTEEQKETLENGMKEKKPPRSERKRRRHDELLLKRREDRKRKKTERKNKLKEQRKDSCDTGERINFGYLKEERRKRCKDAMNNGQKICIDCSLEGFMSIKEKGKLAMQIGRLYGSNLRANSPAHIYLTGLKKGGDLYQECLNKMDGFENYLVDIKEESHTELFPLCQIVCLSPDSDSLLTDLDPEKVYVIGGLVDENIKQNITESRAIQAGIQTARLPIEDNMVKLVQQSHSKVLAVNQVFDILITYNSTKDWKKALAGNVPRRKGFVISHDDAI